MGKRGRDVHKGRMHVTTINVDESVSKSGLQTGCNHCSKTQAGSEQRGGGPAAAEKPIFVDAFAEGEEVMTVTNDEASETWLRDKYKGIKFVDKDVEPEEHRTVFCLKWIRGRRSGPLARRVQRGWYVVSIMDAGRRQAPRRRRRRRPVQRGLPHRRGPLADDPGLGRDVGLG